MSREAAISPAAALGTLPPPLAADLPPPSHEVRAFRQLRLRLVRGAVAQALRQSRFRVLLVVVLSAMLWTGLFLLGIDGLRFLRSAMLDRPMYEQTVAAIFSTFFATLLLMLLFSGAIILYGLLFRGRDVPWLLSLPASDERIFLHKFQEAVFLTGWGFVLLGSPILLAFGIVADAPWFYYTMLPGFVVPFVYLPVALGAVACLLLMRYLPARRRLVLVVVALPAAAAVGWLAFSLLTSPQSDLLTPRWFQELLGRLQFTEGRLLPSWWLAAGLLEAASGRWDQAGMFIALIVSNALVARQLALWTTARFYRAGYSRLSALGRPRRRARAEWLDRALETALRPLGAPASLLVVKDLRLFRRDPVQWSQLAIFFGLLAFYFLNIQRLSYDVHHVAWVHTISFLNLLVVGLLMSTFTTRFVYPMISLEGQRFWLLGLLPIRRETIVLSKFFFAAVGAFVPCAALILLSDAMLGVSPLVLASHQLTCALLCAGLAGIAVGLGARLPNFREPSPARIAAGFGGTLTLVLSSAYIIAVVLLTAVPFHFCLMVRPLGADDVLFGGGRLGHWLRLGLLGGTLGSLALGAAATVVPLALGIRALRKMEF